MPAVIATSYTVQNLLKSHSLCLPYYQRPFVWEDSALKLLEDLFEAFQAHAQGDDESYFIGNILLIGPDGPEENSFDLADGQQRITTLLIILGRLQSLIMKGRSSSEKDKRWARHTSLTVLHRLSEPGQLETSIGLPDADVKAISMVSVGGSSVTLPLTCLRSPITVVQAALARLAQGEVLTLPPGTKKRTVGPNRELRAYAHVSSQVDSWFTSKGLSIDRGDFLEFILAKVEMVVIKYANASVALKCFENLNSKGESLIQTDLLKSAFMKQVPPEKWDRVHLAWDSILEKSGTKSGGEDGFLRTASMAVLFPAFLRAQDAPKRTQLLPRITAYCTTQSIGVEDLLNRIATFAENRAALLSEEPSYPGGATGQVLSRTRRLPKVPDFFITLLSVAPATLSLRAKEHLTKTLEALACVTAIARESKNINYSIQPFCVRLRSLTDDQVASFCEDLTAALIVPNLRSFSLQFRAMDTAGSHKTWAKYILWVAEDVIREGLSKTALSFKDKARGARGAHLEHILPRSGELYYGSIIHQIGNLSLLEPSKNTSIGDQLFEDKLSQYQASEFCITAELTKANHGKETSARCFLDQPIIRPLWDFPTFDPAAIDARTTAIYNLLMAYWHIEEPSTPSPLTLSPISGAHPEIPAETATPEEASPPEHAVEGPQITLGSVVTVRYMGRERTFRLVAEAYGHSKELRVDARAEGRELLGYRAGESIEEGTLFGLNPGLIEILKVTRE